MRLSWEAFAGRHTSRGVIHGACTASTSTARSCLLLTHPRTHWWLHVRRHAEQAKKKEELREVEQGLAQWEQVRARAAAGAATGRWRCCRAMLSEACWQCLCFPSPACSTASPCRSPLAPPAPRQDEKATRARRRAEVDQLKAERERQLEEQANRRQVAAELRRLGDAEASARVAGEVKRQIEVGAGLA